jgi:tetratricopeptide (TPR) repeat protein
MKLIIFAFILLSFVACSSTEEKKESSGSTTSVSEVIADTRPQDSNPPPITSIDTGDSNVEVAAPTNNYQSDVKKAFQAKDGKRIETLISNKLSKEPHDIFSINALGVYYYRGGATKLARLVWDKALKDNGRNAAINNNIGASFLNEDEEKAISFFKKAIQSESSNPYANYNLGSIYLKYKNYSAAESALRVAYGKLKSYDVANNYALALKGNGKVNDSLKVYETIIRTNSNQYQALLNYATLLIETQQSPDKAKDSLNRVKFMSEDRSVLRYVGELERRLGNK